MTQTIDNKTDLLSFFHQLDDNLKNNKYKNMKCDISPDKLYRLGMLTDETIKYLIDKPQYATLLSIYALISSKLDAVYNETFTIEEFIYITNMVHTNSTKIIEKIQKKNNSKSGQYA